MKQAFIKVLSPGRHGLDHLQSTSRLVIWMLKPHTTGPNGESRREKGENIMKLQGIDHMDHPYPGLVPFPLL